MKTCAMTTLRIHSAGSKYAPVLVSDNWQLKNADGNVLCGYRGKIFEFENEKNARTWLGTNLSRVANSTRNVSDERISQIGHIYLDTGDDFALQEIHDIYDFNANIWDAVEIVIDTVPPIDEFLDGGNANG